MNARWREIRSHSKFVLPPAALVLGMVSIASGASFAKALFPLVGAEGATTLRLSIGSLLLVLVLRPWKARFDVKTWHPILIYGMMMGGMNLFFYLSLKTLPLGVAMAIEFVGPLAVATLSSRQPIDFLWIAFAGGGLALVLPYGTVHGTFDPVGVLFALGAGACWGVYILFGRVAGHGTGVEVTAIGMVIAALTVLPVGVVHAGTLLIQPHTLLIATFVAVLSSALPYTLEMFALKHMPIKTFGTLTSCEPAVGALVGLALLGEALPLARWCGISFITLASVGAAMTAIRSRVRTDDTQQLAVD